MPSNSSQTRLPLPWLNSPIPKSFIQPSICATLQKTRVKDSIIPPSYPYIVDANGIHPHFEWRGNGAPPRDVGYPGDIYVDLAAPDYALWARGKSGWTKWTTSSHKADLIAHPHLSDRYLWCSVKNPVWCSISAIKLDRNRRPSLSVVEAIQQVLHNEEEEEAKKGKRSRDQRDSHGSEGADEVSDSDEGSTIRVVPRRGKRGRFVSSASTAGPSHTTSLSVALEESSVSVVSCCPNHVHESNGTVFQSADEQNSIATKKYEDLTIAEGTFMIHMCRIRIPIIFLSKFVCSRMRVAQPTSPKLVSSNYFKFL